MIKISEFIMDLHRLLCFSKDIQFGVKFKPQPHSGWKSGDNEIEDIWVEELEPIADYESSITG